MDTKINECVVSKWNNNKGIIDKSDEEQIRFLIKSLRECGYDKPDIEGQGKEMLRKIRAIGRMSSL